MAEHDILFVQENAQGKWVETRLPGTGPGAQNVVKQAAGLEPGQQAEVRVQNNVNGSGAPGTGNDLTEGYSFRSLWIDTSVTPPKLYKCLDASEGAAVWVNTNLDLDDLGTMAVEEAGDYAKLADATDAAAVRYTIQQANLDAGTVAKRSAFGELVARGFWARGSITDSAGTDASPGEIYFSSGEAPGPVGDPRNGQSLFAADVYTQERQLKLPDSNGTILSSLLANPETDNSVALGAYELKWLQAFISTTFSGAVRALPPTIAPVPPEYGLELQDSLGITQATVTNTGLTFNPDTVAQTRSNMDVLGAGEFLPTPTVLLLSDIPHTTEAVDENGDQVDDLNLINYPAISTAGVDPHLLSSGNLFAEILIYKKRYQRIGYVCPTDYELDGNGDRVWSKPWPQSDPLRGGITTHASGVSCPNQIPVYSPSGDPSILSLHETLNGRWRMAPVPYTDKEGLNYITKPVPLVGPIGNPVRITARYGYGRMFRPLRLKVRYLYWHDGRFFAGPTSNTIKIWQHLFPFNIDHYESSKAGRTVVTLSPGASTHDLICRFE